MLLCSPLTNWFLLVQVMAWCWLCKKSLSNPMVVQICVIHVTLPGHNKLNFYPCYKESCHSFKVFEVNFRYHNFTIEMTLMILLRKQLQNLYVYINGFLNKRLISIAYINGLLQERCNIIANALELHLSCTNPSTCPGSGLDHGQQITSLIFFWM